MRAIIHPTIDVKVTLVLNEREAAALHAITVYGAKNFIEAFYKTLGRHYLEPYANEVEPLFEKLRQLESVLQQADSVRRNLPKAVEIK